MVGLVLCAIGATLTGGCGDDDELPRGVIAKVDDRTITQDALRRAVVGQLAMRHSTRTMPSYLPVDIKGCVAALSKRATAAERTRDESQEHCERDLDRREAAALRFLIRGEWYRLDLRRRGKTVPTGMEAARAASEHSGVAVENLQQVAWIYLQEFKVAEPLLADIPAPTDAQVDKQYRTHQRRYIEAVKRFGPVLIVPTRGEAEAAASLLSKGRSQQQVAHMRSGELTVLYGDKTIFRVPGAEFQDGSAPGVGRIGRVKEERGWVVYRVRDLMPLKEQYSLTEIRPRVERDVQRRFIRAGIARHDAELGDEYQDETICADDHHVPECR